MSILNCGGNDSGNLKIDLSPKVGCVMGENPDRLLPYRRTAYNTINLPF
ncbi:MAG: hypothetical protein HC941_07605 [Microcoleus sp. SU_5_3]|nr:hypothetical protein [Microcoleus sp. SU_5_3]